MAAYCYLDVFCKIAAISSGILFFRFSGTQLELWLALFKAETEEDLAKLEALEVPMVQETIEAYNHVIATEEFRQIERLRAIAERDEASALYNARQEEREKWENVLINALAEKDKELAEKDAIIAKLMAKQ